MVYYYIEGLWRKPPGRDFTAFQYPLLICEDESKDGYISTQKEPSFALSSQSAFALPEEDAPMDASRSG